ncbi:MAG: DUF418 domain-containing protein [Alphaproteobacteria bacterium]|nr:DUF418 domain-containing protein [Alphaproteobacteria bacterium]
MTGADTSAPAPVARAERIETLDVVRGFALFGILLMNIVVMGLPFGAYFNPAYAGLPSEADFTAWFITHTFFEGSMRTLFSMLFGAGFILLLERLEQRATGIAAAKIYMRRLAYLMLFGLIDIVVFLWFGDILLAYGVAGLFLLLFWKATLRGLIIWAVVIMAMTTMFNFGGGEKFAGMQQKYDAAVAARAAGGALTEEQQTTLREFPETISFFQPDEEENEKALETARGGWPSVAGNNFGEIFGTPIGFFATFNVLDPLAAMLLGMIAYRLGLLQGRWSLGATLGLFVVGFGIGVPINLMETQAIIASGYTIHGFFESMRTYDIGRVSLALGWLSVFLLICKAPWLSWIRFAVGSVGRMALSNYLSHSIIAAVFFIGLGYFGALGRAELYIVVAAMWAFNIVFSILWLSVFRMGPFEWLWRWGTYGRLPPLLKERGLERRPPAGEGATP